MRRDDGLPGPFRSTPSPQPAHGARSRRRGHTRHLSVSNSLSDRHWELDQVLAVGDPTDIVQFGTGHHVPPTKVDGVWPFNDAWLRTSLSEARRQAPRNVASILDSARELRIRDAQGVQEPFGLAQREMVEEPQSQGGLDGEIRVPPLPAPPAAPAGRPGSDRLRGQPQRHIAASNEGLIVGWPVRNAVLSSYTWDEPSTASL